MSKENGGNMIHDKLSKIQSELNAPKNQRNTFGNYNYRSCEDILSAVKPILSGCIILLSDELVMIGGRFYVKATATLKDGEETISTTAYAREEETKKGMDAAQITGSASSYARKYALNGLLAIDDTKDADATNTHGKEAKQAPQTPKQPEPRPSTTSPAPISENQRRAIFAIKNQIGMTDEAFKEKFHIEHTSGLTSQQASSIIEQLKAIQGSK